MLELPPLPDKEFFSIGETSRWSQLPAYVLRYWESEFRLLRPARRNSGQRKYTKKDIELIFKIKDLLYERKFTIAGAKKALFGRKKDLHPAEGGVTLNLDLPGTHTENTQSAEFKETLSEAKRELEEILALLR